MRWRVGRLWPALRRYRRVVSGQEEERAVGKDRTRDGGGGRSLKAGRSPAGRRALQLTLTEPETVPMSEQQHQQAVNALSAMICDRLRRRAVADARERSDC